MKRSGDQNVEVIMTRRVQQIYEAGRDARLEDVAGAPVLTDRRMADVMREARARAEAAAAATKGGPPDTSLVPA